MPPAFPDGHFYSPIVDTAEARARRDLLWPDRVADMPGVAFDDALHVKLLREVFPALLAAYDYPDEGDEASAVAFFSGNSQFGWLDARAYFVFLRHFVPRRIIEVGSGFSTLLACDVNDRFLDRRVAMTCIEPYPRAFLQGRSPVQLIEAKVQDVPLRTFEALQAGDVLFIDSSHVAKAGSDVNFLFFEVLPRLARGVRIHVHDIFLPAEYPQDWVIRENRSWNEQYVLRALLMHSSAFRIVFGCSYAFMRHPDLVCDALALPDGAGFGGASLWLEKVA